MQSINNQKYKKTLKELRNQSQTSFWSGGILGKYRGIRFGKYSGILGKKVVFVGKYSGNLGKNSGIFCNHSGILCKIGIF